MKTYQVPMQGIELINNHKVPTEFFTYRVNAESESAAIAQAVAIFQSDNADGKFIDYKVNKVSVLFNLQPEE